MLIGLPINNNNNFIYIVLVSSAKTLYNHTKSYIINKNLQIYNHILLYDT